MRASQMSEARSQTLQALCSIFLNVVIPSKPIVTTAAIIIIAIIGVSSILTAMCSICSFIASCELIICKLLGLLCLSACCCTAETQMLIQKLAITGLQKKRS